MCSKFLVWLLLVQLLEAALQKDFGRIFSAKPVSIEDYGFLVNVRRGHAYKCAGQLISPSCVLTAAQCLKHPHQGQNLYVHAQQQCLEDESPWPHVRQAYYYWISNRFGSYGYDSDIAILKLLQPFDIYGNASTIPIDFSDLPGQVNLSIVGWSQTGASSKRKQCLQGANVTMLSPRECFQRLNYLSPFTGNMFCVLAKNSSIFSAGDPGGPILLDKRTAGIYSWSSGAGSIYPGVYTRLSSLPMTVFIKSIMQRYC